MFFFLWNTSCHTGEVVQYSPENISCFRSVFEMYKPKSLLNTVPISNHRHCNLPKQASIIEFKHVKLV